MRQAGFAGKALVAMSGGVDSSVAALLAQRAGYDCVGVTLRLFDNEDVGETADRPCCSLADAQDAARAAAALGIPHYVFNFAGAFRREVMDRFADAYAAGATPNPCIDCNTYLKFGLLLDRARRMGFDKLVTGHYARISQIPSVKGPQVRLGGGDAPGGERNDKGNSGQFRLSRAAYREKDQTYFLYMMTQEQLARTLFPLAELTKPQVRALAAEAGLPTAEKRESQDICFVRGGDYVAFLEGYRGGTKASVAPVPSGASDPQGAGNGLVPGLFVDDAGRALGRHSGIARYTIGQRKGLGVTLGKPAFVAEIRAVSNEVVLSTEESSLFREKIEVGEVNWIEGQPPAGPVRAEVQVRYGAAPAPARILFGGSDSEAKGGTGATQAQVCFDKPVRAPARGQAAVFYDGDTVLGGGRIL